VTFKDLMSVVIHSEKWHMNMGLIFSGYVAVEKFQDDLNRHKT
jgi:hypothetical protein